MFTYNANVNKVIDGDTIDVSIDLGFDIWHKTRLRLANIDAPESRTPLGKAVKVFLANVLDGRDVIITTTKPDKYGRYLAEVYLPDSMVSINEQMIIDGIAKRYSGDSKLGLWTVDELKNTKIDSILK